MTAFRPFAHTSGPHDSKVVILGEAWGEQEEKLGKPFIGASGQELTRLLSEAGFKRSELLLTNVLALRPPGNKIEALCASKKEMPSDYSHPPLAHGKYLLPGYFPHLERLRTELEAFPRTLVIALGNSACWALLNTCGIGSLRGVIAESTFIKGLKVLPTYHPAGVLRNWAWRPIVLADLLKAKGEADSAEIERPKRWILVDPTLEEIEAWITSWGERASALAVDIETKNGQITEIGFAASPSQALVVPFVTPQGEDYWKLEVEEYRAWDLVDRLLSLSCPKIFQNGLYDLQYLAKMGLRPRNVREDTMLLHHSLFPEMQKSLAFMGSIYTKEASWKLTYRKAKKEETKRDE